MILYKLIVIIPLGIIVFIPIQIDVRINYIIWILAFTLIPIFVKNFLFDLKSKNPVTILFLLFLAVSALSTIFSIDQNRSLITFFTYISYFVIFTSIRSIFPSLKSKQLFTFYFLLLTSILSIISLYNTLILNYVNKEQEGVSFMWIYYGHNHLATLLLFALPIAFYLLKTYWKNKKIRALLFVTCTMLLITLFFTLARSNILALIIASFISLPLFLKNLKTISLSIIIIGIVTSIFIFLFGLLAQENSFITRKTRMHFFEGSLRITYWKHAIGNFQKHPVFGSGLDTFRIVNKREYKPEGVLRSYYAHNFFLQMLSDAGILGFLSSIGLIASVLWCSFRNVRKLAIGSDRFFYFVLFIGIFSSTLMTMLDMGWQLPTVFLFFWIIAGFLSYA